MCSSVIAGEIVFGIVVLPGKGFVEGDVCAELCGEGFRGEFCDSGRSIRYRVKGIS
jgi:hypothetical protein